MVFMSPTEQPRVVRRHPATPRATRAGQWHAWGDVCDRCGIEDDEVDLSQVLGNVRFEA
jgi:hypothetical protein